MNAQLISMALLCMARIHAMHPQPNIHVPEPQKSFHRSVNETDIKINISTDTPESSNTTEETVTVSEHKKRIIQTNCLTAIAVSLIGAGVTLAIEFGNCKK
jgi:hypothetical protein